MCVTYADMAMSNGIESFLVIYDLKDKKLDTTDNFNKFDVSVCKGLAFVYTFTGYDTASSFYQVGKATTCPLKKIYGILKIQISKKITV